MDLTTLTHPSAVCVQARYTSRDEAIRQLTQRLVALGKIEAARHFWLMSFTGNRLALPRWEKVWRYRMANLAQ